MFACCLVRGGDEKAVVPRKPHSREQVRSGDERGCAGGRAAAWAQRLSLRRPGAGKGAEVQLEEEEEELAFFDCIETELELFALLSPALAAHYRTQPRLSFDNCDERPGVHCRSDCCSGDLALLAAKTSEELVGELTAAAAVLERTREQWSRRVMDLRKGFDESCADALSDLKWADLSQAQRMLQANIGDVQKAVEMFLQALEFRARDRELFEHLRCDVRCDMRIIGWDRKAHPVVYMCARSQTEPLRFIRDQFVVTFEAACQLATPGEGRVYFVADMHGLRPQLNMDMAAVKDLADMLGTVYAERIFRIVVVDFSRAAQAAWWMVKQLLKPVTRDKFAFVGEAKALQMCERDFDGATYERLLSASKMNRDPTSSPDQRAIHARRTTIHNVPLGPPLN